METSTLNILIGCAFFLLLAWIGAVSNYFKARKPNVSEPRIIHTPELHAMKVEAGEVLWVSLRGVDGETGGRFREELERKMEEWGLDFPVVIVHADMVDAKVLRFEEAAKLKQ